MFTSEGSFDDEDDLFPSASGLDFDDPYELHLNVRVRVEAGAMRVKLWEVGDAEPGAWTMEDASIDLSPIDGQLVSLGIWNVALSHFSGGGQTHTALDGVAITDGCA